MARVGANLLIRNLAEQPLHLRATQFAMESLVDSDFTETDWRVQVLDDASTCLATKTYLAELGRTDPERIKVSTSEEQLGIARGRNAANRWFAKEWQPDYVVELHTDHVFPSYWLRPLLEAMEANPRLGIVSPMLLTGRPMGWSSECVALNYAGEYGEARAAVEAAAARHRSNRAVRPGLTHPALKRWRMLQELGGYAEDMPGLQNFEDTEEAYRAMQLGWEVRISPGSVVWHWYAFSRTRATPDHHADYILNRNYCKEKHGSGFERWCEELGRDMDAVYSREEARA